MGYRARGLGCEGRLLLLLYTMAGSGCEVRGQVMSGGGVEQAAR